MLRYPCQQLTIGLLNLVLWRRGPVNRILTLLGAVWLLIAALAAADEPMPAATGGGLEFFEKRIRPLLADNCYQCHGAKKQESGLVLNTAAGIKRGGDRGTAVSPGEPDASVLIQAVRYHDDDLKMPPRGKLKDEQIADLVTWIKIGAPLPETDATTTEIAQPSNEFNLAERRKHWAYQPVQDSPLPLAGTKPGPGDPQQRALENWSLQPTDEFILAGLHAADLSPAAPVEKRTLL